MKELLRDNIANLIPYSCARNDFKGKADVYLDANENWRDYVGDKNRNRYPDPLCTVLRTALDEVLGLPFSHTVVGNGSDEIIDNLFRMFCRPGKDSVIIMPPTYGAYRVFADINDVAVREISLTEDFALDFDALIQYLKQEKLERTADSRCKMLFICSPNNPSGNAFPLDQIERVCSLFDGITIVDEAYFDFSPYASALTLQEKFPNLVVLRTLSKCWALANARVGICIASEELCAVMASMKYPYNVPGPSQEIALEVLKEASPVKAGLTSILAARKMMEKELLQIPCVEKIFPSDSNFLLVRVSDATALYRYLAENGIIVRNRSKEKYCANCLRITVGNEAENNALLTCMREFKGVSNGK
ncbi:histidinol-phosphate aminotransferase [Sphaerochaeta pleomorpha str. Grapes]|uniref:Histidinol-phosphate aminotransferase n=1 Tax=Sphaerochaeta pleomorpha (strain ATCC BAA-1885 / DSM 22778 / Grapes) TaxID=158190 RepID=G8QTT9_SPHPG|nr:histidinol-phosphate transaminase [Sphaerochaeta pleomorpha]AEV29115.1 histidinol-phosphate aminotransferase [Sphaerochaeta pleomorpha str. Grapes]